MARRVFRYEVPVDDQPHRFQLTSDPLYAANVAPSDWLGVPEQDFKVEFWAEHTDAAPTVTRAFQVFGTGHKLPDDARWISTLPRTREGLVWHLYEVAP